MFIAYAQMKQRNAYIRKSRYVNTCITWLKAKGQTRELSGLSRPTLTRDGPRPSALRAGRKNNGRAAPSGRVEPGPRPRRHGRAELVEPGTPARLHPGRSRDLGAGSARTGCRRPPRLGAAASVICQAGCGLSRRLRALKPGGFEVGRGAEQWIDLRAGKRGRTAVNAARRIAQRRRPRRR